MKDKIINKNFETNNVITCDNINVFVGPKKHKQLLIHNFNYAFEKGKIYAIVGPSGVGKTTLLSHICGLAKTRHGDIFIKDKAILGKQKKIKNSKALRKDITLVLQFPEYQLFKDTVEKDICYGPINYHVNKEQAKNIATKYMYLVGLDKALAKSNPFDLSNGQKRLVAIAGVLALETDIVVFDEPTAGLDPSYQKKVVDLIKKLSKLNKTIIIVSHDMNKVLELADQVLVLDNGSLIKSGTPYEIFTNKNLMKKACLTTPHVLEFLNNLNNKKLIARQPRNLDELVSLLKKGGR